MAGKGVWPVKKFSVSPDRLKELKFQFLGSYLKKKFKLLKFVRGGKKRPFFPPPTKSNRDLVQYWLNSLQIAFLLQIKDIPKIHVYKPKNF